MPEKVNFTKVVINGLKPPQSGRVYVYDAKSRGLCICLTSAGGRVWYLYRKIDGRPERYKIGAWPEVTVEAARTEAARLNGDIAKGMNPNAKRQTRRSAPTLGEVFDEYIELPTRGKAKRPRSAKTIKDYRWQFGKYLDCWRNRKLPSITRTDIDRLHNDIGTDHGRYIANRVLSLLKAVLNYGVECEYITVNPAARLRPFEEESRDRYLEEHELSRFWSAVEQEEMADFFKLSLFTGVRQGNVLSARWDHFDLDRAVWNLPQVKGAKPLTVPLPPPAVDILRARRDVVGGEWVFPNGDDTGPAAVPKHGWDRIREASGITDIRMHDLRRTIGSWQASNNSSEAVVGRSLGHASVQATKIYARVNLEAARASMDAAVDLILGAVKAGEGKELDNGSE